jgi:hypothetical protein
VVALVAALAPALFPGAALANHTQESIFQDDQYLLDSPTPVVSQTLATLKTLGVQRIRVNVLWVSLAPDPLSRKRPANFVASDPASYPAGAWAPYDRLVELSATYGINVDFTVTAPGPLWAMGAKPVTTRAANHWTPNSLDFYNFMVAVGLRYSGVYTPPASASGPLPAVTFWSIWNEPDQPGWLSPQSRRYKHRWVINSPRIYRSLVDAAYFALGLTGHSTANNTILIGELAPEGYTTPGAYVATTPLPFVRALYCVNGDYRQLRGDAAIAVGCRKHESRAEFVKKNPLLFTATGFAHHPYYFFHTPSYRTSDPNFAPLANIGRLGRALNRIYGNYGVHRTIPFYFTEYGYETNPPDPHRPVTPDQQAAYLNEADYMAWRNPRVRSVAQFLLYDSPPDPRYTPTDPSYWDTFQTGLLFANGKPKPAFDAYRMPIWIPSAKFHRGARTFVWGDLRGAPHTSTQTAMIQWRPRHGGSWTTVATVPVTSLDGFFTARVKIPGTGLIRSEWLAPGGGVEASRSVEVTRS